MAVALARSEAADSRLLLPPPPLTAEFTRTTLTALLKRCLSSLKVSNDRVGKVTAMALENCEDDRDLDNDLEIHFQRDSHHMTSIPTRRFSSEERLVELSLLALLGQSSSERPEVLVKKAKILPVLSRICREHPNNPMIKSLIGKIIANLCLSKETHLDVFASGWIRKLSEWRRHSNLLISLPAIKALRNLDQESCGETVLKPGLYQLLPDNARSGLVKERFDYGVDVVFIHGLLGGVFYTWRQLDIDNSRGWESNGNLVSTDDYSYCWPCDWLKDVESKNNDHLRVYGVDFDTSISQWGNGDNNKENFNLETSLKDRSRDILDKLLSAGIGQNGRSVIFVGHSMGGLIIKKMLIDAQDKPEDDSKAKELLNNTKGIVFYGCPHKGSRIAKLNAASKYLFFPSVEVQDLEADSPQLLELHEDFLHLYKSRSEKIDIVSFGETKATPYMGVDLTFVPRESSDPGIGQHLNIDTNHMNICKPGDKNSPLFAKLRKMIRDTLDDITPFE